MKKIDIDLELLKKMYIDQNMTLVECVEFFGVSKATIHRHLAILGIKKDPKMVSLNTDKTWAKKGKNRTEDARERLKNIQLETGIHPSRTQEACAKRAATNLNLYGTDNPFGNSQVKDKIKNTMSERYGVDYAGQSMELQHRVQQAVLSKYGVLNYGELALSEEKRTLLNSKELFSKYIEDNDLHTISSIAKSIGCSTSTVIRRVEHYGLEDKIDITMSYGERELNDFFDSLGIKHYKTRDVIAPYEIDIYLPDYNVGIEFNGDYWHSTNKLPIEYHKDKYNLAKDKGIFIFYIYEYEWLTNSDSVLENIRMILNHQFVPEDNEYTIENGKVPEYVFIENGYELIEEIEPQPINIDELTIYNAGYKVWRKVGKQPNN